jgi:hypothetical protein
LQAVLFARCELFQVLVGLALVGLTLEHVLGEHVEQHASHYGTVFTNITVIIEVFVFAYFICSLQNAAYTTSQVTDLAEKLEQVEGRLTRTDRSKEHEEKLGKAIKDGKKFSSEVRRRTVILQIKSHGLGLSILLGRRLIVQ